MYLGDDVAVVVVVDGNVVDDDVDDCGHVVDDAGAVIDFDQVNDADGDDVAVVGVDANAIDCYDDVVVVVVVQYAVVVDDDVDGVVVGNAGVDGYDDGVDGDPDDDDDDDDDDVDGNDIDDVVDDVVVVVGTKCC